jgi:hypothetical protein
MATAAKDMRVANLIEPWKGDQSSVPVHEFFEAIDKAAEVGRLSAKDKLRLARLKLRGVAKSFYSTQPELEGDDVEYADFKPVVCRDLKRNRQTNIIIQDCRMLLKRKMRVPKCI